MCGRDGRTEACTDVRSVPNYSRAQGGPGPVGGWLRARVRGARLGLGAYIEKKDSKGTRWMPWHKEAKKDV